METKQNKLAHDLTRREMLRIGSAAAAAAGPLLMSLACEHKTTQEIAAPAAQRTCSYGVFCTCWPPTSTQNNYKSEPDAAEMYPLFAFLLMLTTEEWDYCLHSGTWQGSAASDFGMVQHDFDLLYRGTHDPSTSAGPISSLEYFKRLRAIWQKFRKHILTLSSPYPGGGALLQIARVFSSGQAPKYLSEYCGGTPGQVNATLPQLGPVAFWLMLITEDWSRCLKTAGWLQGLAKQFGVDDPSILQDLYDESVDATARAYPPLSTLTFPNKDAFFSLQTLWSTWLNPLGGIRVVYGRRPCAGPQTLLKIATGGK